MSNIVSIGQQINDANLDQLFHVSLEQVTGSTTGLIANRRSVVVDGKSVNLVSDKYAIHQPLAIYQKFKDIASRTGLEVKSVMTNKAKGSMLIRAFHDDISIVGEDHRPELLFYTSHCGQYVTFLTWDLLRMQCFNQIPTLSANRDRFLFKEKHYNRSLDIEVIGKLVEDLPTIAEQYEAQSKVLLGERMDFPAFVRWYTEFKKLDKDSSRYDGKIAMLEQAYNHQDQSMLPESKYRAYQAVTWLNTHNVKNTVNLLESKVIGKPKDSLKSLESLQAA